MWERIGAMMAHRRSRPQRGGGRRIRSGGRLRDDGSTAFSSGQGLPRDPEWIGEEEVEEAALYSATS